MPVTVSQSEVLKQSEAVFNQFGPTTWIPNAQENAKLVTDHAEVLRNSGVGKTLLLVASGASLEDNIDVIKKYRDRVDILVNDKGFGPLLDHGVKADFCMLCDARIPFRYLEPWVDKTTGVTLISTCYGNTEWTKAWKGKKFFYVNRDSIFSERIFIPIMPKGTRTIPAGSNVSNAMLVFFTGSDNTQNINWSGYDRFLLIGYDYSWRVGGNYYAWQNPEPKRYYMAHRTMLDLQGNIVRTSENLLFSAKWLYSYITTFRLPVVNCSERGLLMVGRGTLEKELARINPDPSARKKVQEIFSAGNHAFRAANEMMAIFEQARGGLLLWQ